MVRFSAQPGAPNAVSSTANYHRFHAHRALGLCDIAAEVRVGNALDAITASLQANAEHGKRRVGDDFRRGYQIAVNYGLVAETDSEAVAQILRCSVQWARDLTASARERERILLQNSAEARKAAGMSNRGIAKDLGVSKDTVNRMLGGSKGKPFDLSQPIEADPSDPRQLDIVDAVEAYDRAAGEMRARVSGVVFQLGASC